MKVKPVYPDMFSRIYPMLRMFEQNTPELSTKRWLRLFDYGWECDSMVRGFFLEDKGNVVGFRAYIQHVRNIDGCVVRMISASSWVVLPDYRGRVDECTGEPVSNLLLVAPESWFRDESHCLIGVTVRPQLINRLSDRGYEVLETEAVMTRVTPWAETGGWRMIHRPSQVRALLDEGQRQLFDDHRNLPCLQLVATRGDERCYIVICLRPSGRFTRLARVVHLSHGGRFESALGAIGWHLLKRHRVRWIEWDSRWLAGRMPPGAVRRPLPSPRMFKSDRLRPEQIDNLYSEIVLLEL